MSNAANVYSGLPPTRDVRLQTRPNPRAHKAKPAPSKVPTQASGTDKTIEVLLKAAERRKELGEEYVPPQPVSRKRPRSPSTSPEPPTPRVKLQKPLSFLTKEMTHIPLIDIEAYVNRPISERQAEAEKNKHPGKVKRPMNSFMLYRKAYQHRAKEYGFMTNHQVVSQLCGDSWPLEPEEVKEQFAEWARIEREHHEEAHPGYKYTPARPRDSTSANTSLIDDLFIDDD